MKKKIIYFPNFRTSLFTILYNCCLGSSEQK